MTMSDHFLKTNPVELTDHERTIIMMLLSQNDDEQRKLGHKLAYNRNWQNVFQEPVNRPTGNYQYLNQGVFAVALERGDKFLLDEVDFQNPLVIVPEFGEET